MQLYWILSPIAQYGFLWLAVVICLVLFLSLKKEIALVRCSATESRDSEAVSVANLTAGIEALRQEKESPAAPPFAGQKLNLTQRAQALRMQRRGESPPTIAAALRLPRNEIELLLKVQKLVNDHGLPPTHGGSKLAPSL